MGLRVRKLFDDDAAGILVVPDYYAGDVSFTGELS